MLETKEELFEFEREKGRPVFDKYYKSKNLFCKRIYGKDNRKYDCLIKINGKWVKVEEKYRSRYYPDLLVETKQDTETNSPGWIEETEADYLLYGVKERIFAVDIPKLKSFVERNKNNFDKIISKKGWGRTENIAIPWYVLESNGISKIVQQDGGVAEKLDAKVGSS